jgi:hypothetical protein
MEPVGRLAALRVFQGKTLRTRAGLRLGFRGFFEANSGKRARVALARKGPGALKLYAVLRRLPASVGAGRGRRDLRFDLSVVYAQAAFRNEDQKSKSD